MILFQFLFIRWPVPIGDLLQVKKGWNKAVIICWVFCPSSIMQGGGMPIYLSSVLYSGSVKEMIICVKPPNEKTPDLLFPYYIKLLITVIIATARK